MYIYVFAYIYEYIYVYIIEKIDKYVEKNVIYLILKRWTLKEEDINLSSVKISVKIFLYNMIVTIIYATNLSAFQLN